MTNEKSLASVQEDKIRLRALPSRKYLEKKVEQELKELLKIQNDVIEKIKEIVDRLESL